MEESNEKKYLLLPDKGDGFGSQYQAFIWGILYAGNNNYIYVYRNVNNIEHNYNKDENFIDKIEKLINLKNNYINEKDLDSESSNVFIDQHTVYQDVENNLDFYLESEDLIKIKKCFWENKDKDVFKNNKINVAIHIRRPNPHDNRILGTDTPDEYYLKVINLIKTEYDNEKLCFHIYSQGSIENFKKFMELENIIFHLDSDLIETFVELVGADILVTSASSFSYSAAWISDNIIYYLPFWHKPSQKWKIMEK